MRDFTPVRISPCARGIARFSLLRCARSCPYPCPGTTIVIVTVCTGLARELLTSLLGCFLFSSFPALLLLFPLLLSALFLPLGARVLLCRFLFCFAPWILNIHVLWALLPYNLEAGCPLLPSGFFRWTRLAVLLLF